MEKEILNCLTCNKPLTRKQDKYCSNTCQSERNHLSEKISNSDLQVILTGVFGDGCLHKRGNNHYYSTSSIHKTYINFKLNLFNQLKAMGPYKINNTGYKSRKIYSMYTQEDPQISVIAGNTIKGNLELMDDLGIALWFFDDGSLHAKKHFYNLNTQKFSREVHEEFLIPYFKKKWGAEPKLAQERKKDGRHFYYLRFNKTFPTTIISSLLEKYPPAAGCFNYKVI